MMGCIKSYVMSAEGLREARSEMVKAKMAKALKKEMPNIHRLKELHAVEKRIWWEHRGWEI